jgi:hypothetical protein
VDAELVERLARIRRRAAVAGEVADAAGVAAMRSACFAPFDASSCIAGLPEQGQVELIGAVPDRAGR